MLPFYQEVISVRYTAGFIFAQGGNLYVWCIANSCGLCSLDVFL